MMNPAVDAGFFCTPGVSRFRWPEKKGEKYDIVAVFIMILPENMSLWR